MFLGLWELQLFGQLDHFRSADRWRVWLGLLDVASVFGDIRPVGHRYIPHEYSHPASGAEISAIQPAYSRPRRPLDLTKIIR